MGMAQYSSTVEEIAAMLNCSENKKASSLQYLQAYPGQAAESGFFILAMFVMTNKEAPEELVDFARSLYSQVDQLLD